jgi:beta-N-acetylhexosaminidase
MNKKLAIGPVMIDIEGLSLTSYDREKIAHPNTGAVILFTRNYSDRQQVSALTQDIKSARNGPILIAVDQEGGRVQRFQEGFTCLPPALSYLDNPDCIQSAGWLMASELLAVGVDFSFAPVLDIDCGISQIIGDRSFSRDPAQTAELASKFRKGMNLAGMSAVGKHFPGHGAVALDSHLTLPIDPRNLDDIRKKDLLPFKRLISEGLEGIMPAHVVYPEIDSQPAGFSQIWIEQILRTELGFGGAVFSDDLSMEGAACVGDFAERGRIAQKSGCDMILVCNNPNAAEQVLDTTPVLQNAIREQRLLHMLGKPSSDFDHLCKTEKWQQVSSQLSHITTA